MSEELLQLLFFAFIFIALPALDGVLRGKKKRRGPPGRGPVEEAEVAREPAREREAPWDSAETSPPPGGARERAETPRSSEGLLPADLWEELAALARGERRPDRVPPVTDDAPDSAAGTGPTEPERPEPGDVPLTTAGAEDYRAPSSQPATQRSRAARPLPQKPASRRSWRDTEPSDGLPAYSPTSRQPTPARGPTPGRGSLGRREAFPVAAASPIETGAIGTAAEQGGHGAAEEALVALHHMSKDDLKRAVIFREVLGPPISERPGPLAESREP
jgi:hypothetical protein